jgi:hypothetical protein
LHNNLQAESHAVRPRLCAMRGESDNDSRTGLRLVEIMSFYLRKSVSVGPLRFNLSKSGIGVSAGVRGLRLGAGPRGNYIHMGRHGLYYRATLPTGRRSTHVAGASAPNPTPSDNVAPLASGDVSAMVDSSSQSLLDELNEKRRRWRTWPWVLATLFLLSRPVLSIVGTVDATSTMPVAPLYLIGYFVVAMAAIAVAHHFDTMRRTTVLLYNLDDEATARYQRLYEAVDVAGQCDGVWHVTARTRVANRKYNAGAAENVLRSRVRLRSEPPATVRTNVSVPSIPAGDKTLYLFPDRLLIFGRSAVGAVPYDALKLQITSSRFVESGSVPKDATVVGSTWSYVNKGGGPDKRFKNNRQIPIAMYEQLLFNSATGLNELFQVSKIGVGQPLAEALTQLKTTSPLLFSADIAATAAAPGPAPVRTAQQQARDARRRADYEKEFPYDEPKPADERLPRGGPTVSGGLPSLGKRR